MRFDIDDRVYYTSGRHGVSKSNPLKGSDYECQGTVYTGVSSSIRVRWDNGTTNGYFSNDLERVCQLHRTDPNRQWATRKKIRR